jgi:hypothetical protein
MASKKEKKEEKKAAATADAKRPSTMRLNDALQALQRGGLPALEALHDHEELEPYLFMVGYRGFHYYPLDVTIEERKRMSESSQIGKDIHCLGLIQ